MAAGLTEELMSFEIVRTDGAALRKSGRSYDEVLATLSDPPHRTGWR